MSLRDWAGGRIFNLVHGRNLVYNTCWEDPRLDRRALQLGPQDTVLVITSAGCNALDYVLAGPKQVIAVDVNPRQNALLELKLAGIRNLEFEDFFAMFGRGRLARAERVYVDKLRPSLSDGARRYWDRWITLFEQDNRRPFYYRGTSGTFALLVNFYISHVVRLRPWVNDVLATQTVEEQQEIYRPASPRSLLVVDDAVRHAARHGTVAPGGAARPTKPDRDAVRRAVLPNSSSIASRRCFPACRCPTTTSGAST